MEEYPDIDNPNFQFLIAQRLEFRNLYNTDGLYAHQEFVRRFMSPYTPYKSLILYHSLGSGKSIACIAVAIDHYLHSRRKCIIVTKGDSGTINFVNQIQMYHDMSISGRENKWNMSMFTMKHYISLSNQINNMSDDEIVNAFSNCIIVLDEVHNVRYLKKVTEHSVYGSIIRVLKLCKGIKIIIATATPMTDNHEQINSLLGICNHSRSDSHSMRGIISYNCVIQDRPASTEMGTLEYVPGVRVWASEMTGHQKKAYSEEDTDKPPEDIYRKLTHISLFCFDDGTHGKEVTENKMKKTKMLATITSMSTKHTKQIRYVKYSILPEFSESLVGDALRNSSSKYSAVIDLLNSSSGNVFIFLEEVKGSGLLLLASILEHHGYELYLGDDIENMHPGKRYTMCVGSSDICPNNNDRLEGFNCDTNKNGDYVRILLGSRVIGESITLKNVRQFYCLTPHWNDSTVDQAIGRVVRNKSHASLDVKDRNVNVYIHVSIFLDNPNNSVDIKKLLKCKEKEKDILKVSQRMVDEAVDKYCLGHDLEACDLSFAEKELLQIKHVGVFAVAYVHHHENRIARLIMKSISHCSGPVNVYDLSYSIDIHPTVCKEVLCRMISSNVRVENGPLPLLLESPHEEEPPRAGFIRAYGDTVFVIDDPSTPYVMVPRVMPMEVSQRIIPGAQTKGLRSTGRELVEGTDTRFPNAIQAFRRMQVKDKAAFLEYCIESSALDVLKQISTAYAKIGDTIYHLLLYRDLESSYTSSNPVPKRPLGKTRAFDEIRKTWWTVESTHDEQLIFDAYRELVSNALEQADKTLKIYGVISTIDGEMRLRLRGTENIQKSSNDRRYIKRGKNIKSIRKERLIDILLNINKTSNVENKDDNKSIFSETETMSQSSVSNRMSINEIVELIDRVIVESKLYIVL
jgi:hypothetical protein